MILKPISIPEDRPVLVQTTPQPLMRGLEPDGMDQYCPNCGRTIILQQIVEGEVYDVALKCFACAGLCVAPRFPAGRGLGGIITPVKPGVHFAGSTFVNAHHSVIVGWPGIERRAKETGKVLTIDAPRTQRHVEANLDAICAIIERARAIFAPILPELEIRDQRARLHRGSLPATWHRLPLLIHQLEQTIHGVRSGGDEIDIISFLELHRICDVFSRWREDPSFPNLLSSARDPRNFNHNVVMLVAASVLDDAGLGAELFVDSSRKAPDLRIAVALRRYFLAEVKAPKELQRVVGIDVGFLHNRDLIRRCLDEADEQLLPEHAGVLLVGGSFWGGDFELLEEEGRQLWARKGERRRHLAAVMFVSTGIQYARRPETLSLPFDWSQVGWIPDIAGRWIANPHYTGDIRLDFPRELFGEYKISFQGAQL